MSALASPETVAIAADGAAVLAIAVRNGRRHVGVPIGLNQYLYVLTTKSVAGVTHIVCCSSAAVQSAAEEQELGDFPPSAKLVFMTLEYEGPLTQKALVERTELASRTVRNALNTLQESGYVEEQLYHEDLRQRQYHVVDK